MGALSRNRCESNFSDNIPLNHVLSNNTRFFGMSTNLDLQGVWWFQETGPVSLCPWLTVRAWYIGAIYDGLW